MDTLIGLKKPLRRQSPLLSQFRSANGRKKSVPIPDLPPPGVTAGLLDDSRKSKICFVKLYEECLRNAKLPPIQSLYSSSYKQRHYNTPTKQISNESIFTCYKESVFEIQNREDSRVRVPDVSLMLELDYT